MQYHQKYVKLVESLLRKSKPVIAQLIYEALEGGFGLKELETIFKQKQVGIPADNKVVNDFYDDNGETLLAYLNASKENFTVEGEEEIDSHQKAEKRTHEYPGVDEEIILGYPKVVVKFKVYGVSSRQPAMLPIKLDSLPTLRQYVDEEMTKWYANNKPEQDYDPT